AIACGTASASFWCRSRPFGASATGCSAGPLLVPVPVPVPDPEMPARTLAVLECFCWCGTEPACSRRDDDGRIRNRAVHRRSLVPAGARRGCTCAHRLARHLTPRTAWRRARITGAPHFSGHSGTGTGRFTGAPLRSPFDARVDCVEGLVELCD